jgi:hypothetical protein
MDNVMTSDAELSVLVPEIWSQNFYDVLLAELPFSSVIDRSWEGELSLGDTVKISTFPEFGEAVELTEGERNTASAVTVSQQSLVINKRVALDFIVTNKALLQSLPFVDKLRDLAIYSIMKKIESTIISTTIPSAATPDHQIDYDTATTLVLADILEAKELLDDQDVPASDRHLVLGPEQYNDIYNITNFTSSDFLSANANAPSQTGQLPPMMVGFMPHLTSLVGATTYLFHSSYMTMAVQQGMNITQYDLGVDGKRALRVNCDLLYGLKQLDNKRVVTLS